MGGPQPLGTLIISSGKLLRTVWMYLRMNKDGFFRTPPPQDSAQGWVNLVLTFAGLCKRETYFRVLPSDEPKLCGQRGQGRGARGCVGRAEACRAKWVPDSSWGAESCQSSADLQGSLGLIYAFMGAQKMLAQREN